MLVVIVKWENLKLGKKFELNHFFADYFRSTNIIGFKNGSQLVVQHNISHTDSYLTTSRHHHNTTQQHHHNYHSTNTINQTNTNNLVADQLSSTKLQQSTIYMCMSPPPPPPPPPVGTSFTSSFLFKSHHQNIAASFINPPPATFTPPPSSIGHNHMATNLTSDPNVSNLAAARRAIKTPKTIKKRGQLVNPERHVFGTPDYLSPELLLCKWIYFLLLIKLLLSVKILTN